MENYTITKLAEMFGITRNTVYKKLEDSSIKQFIDVDERGTKTLRVDGFNAFQMLIAHSKAGSKQEINAQNSGNNSPNYMEIYIQSLHDQIELLKQIIERLQSERAEISRKHDALFDVYVELTKHKRLLDIFRGNKK